MVPNLKHAYTVCESIAKIYGEKYGTRFQVVRNVPHSNTFTKDNSSKTISGKIILYQGALNIGRGLEQAIRAMKYVENATLIIAGDGDIKSELEKLVAELTLYKKVKFTRRLPLEELSKLTSQADLGLSIEEDLGLNYRYALPNKLFDYIQAGVPVLVTNLPEMAAIVNHYKIGLITNSLEPKELAKTFQHALTDDQIRNKWKQNLETASKELIWENEEKVLIDIFSTFVNKYRI
jgi:glycosyltransferase involved in cell wall biosynthesis